MGALGDFWGWSAWDEAGKFLAGNCSFSKAAAEWRLPGCGGWWVTPVSGCWVWVLCASGGLQGGHRGPGFTPHPLMALGEKRGKSKKNTLFFLNFS